MAPQSSTLARKIPWTEEPGRLQSLGLLRVRHDWVASLSLFTFHALEKEMAAHSCVLAWRIPGTGEPGGLPSVGSHRVRHDWSDLAAAAAAAVIVVVAIVVQPLSRVHPFATPSTAAPQASLSFTISQSFAQTHVHWVSDAIQPSYPLLPPSPPTFNLFQH